MTLWQAGMTVQPTGVCISYEMCIGNEGKRPDIHNNREIAQQAGFSEALVAGPHLLTLTSEAFTRVFGVDWIETGELTLEFLKPVLATQELELSGVVRAVELVGERTQLVTLDVLGTGSDGKVRFRGVARVASHSPGHHPAERS